MTLDPTAMLAAYCEVKVHVCRDNNGPADVVPILQFRATRSGENHFLPLMVEGHPVDALRVVVPGLRRAAGEIDWVAFLADTFVKMGDIGETLRDYERGSFAVEHGRDAATTVRQALALTWLDSTGDGGFMLASYSFDGPLPVFDPVLTPPELAGGAIIDALRLAFTR